MEGWLAGCLLILDSVLLLLLLVVHVGRTGIRIRRTRNERDDSYYIRIGLGIGELHSSLESSRNTNPWAKTWRKEGKSTEEKVFFHSYGRMDLFLSKSEIFYIDFYLPDFHSKGGKHLEIKLYLKNVGILKKIAKWLYWTFSLQIFIYFLKCYFVFSSKKWSGLNWTKF